MRACVRPWRYKSRAGAIAGERADGRLPRVRAGEPIFFASALELRAWLEANHRDRDELIVGFYKKGTKKGALTWSDAVDEAICVGWIDGVRRTLDDARYVIRFTPRRPRSIWSAVNVEKVARLTREGRMRPEGIAAFEARTAERTAIYSFEQKEARELDSARAAKLAANRAARTFFAAQPPWYRRVAVFWVMGAKKEETRDRRLDALITSCASGELLPWARYGRRAASEKKSAR
jgi:uncharacterized protein YdeI (YjbR/CyaY-like superfamily)